MVLIRIGKSQLSFPRTLLSKKWLWLTLWAVGMVLVLTVHTDSIWLRGLLVASVIISVLVLVCDHYKRVHAEVKRLRGDT
jgi:hypothetical protein